MTSSPHPDAEGCCYDCLPADMQKAYDKFFGHDDTQKRIVDFFNEDLDRKLDDGLYESFSAENRDSSMTYSGPEQPWSGTE